MKKPAYIPFRPFVIRTPLFPLSGIADRSPTEDNVFGEAVFIASPDLYREFKAGKSTADEESGNKKDKKNDTEKPALSFEKYYSRSRNRCTPFGLFAGCTSGELGDATQICLAPQDRYTRATRPDMNYLCALIQHIEQKPDIRRQLPYYPNDTIYEMAGRIRYVEYFYRKSHRVHRLNSVESSDYLRRILEGAAGGAKIADLAALVVDDEVTQQEAEEFVDELIDSQLLKSGLEANVTGGNQLEALIGRLEKLENVEDLAIIREIGDLLSEIDSMSPGSCMQLYDKVHEAVGRTGVAFEPKFILQTDMYKPAEKCSVDAGLVEGMNDLISFLMKTSRPAGASNLDEFRKAFMERYEGRQMPLSEVLDKELGLGFPVQTGNTGDLNPLIDDLYLPANGGSADTVATDIVDRVLLKKYIEAVKTDEHEIVLTDKDFPSNRINPAIMPDILSVLCSIRQTQTGVPNIVFKGITGSATQIIARFCHLDPSIEAMAREATAKEQEMNPNVVYAEIAHLPESRVGNILLRPVLRDYEIHYMAAPGIAPDGRLPLSDLLVSIEAGRIVLRSRKLGKEVVPRLSNAHNFNNKPMPVYRFLCELQYQGKQVGLWMDWGEIFRMFDNLPRVVYKNYILIPRKWTIETKKLEKWHKSDDAELLKEVAALRAEKGLTRHVVLSVYDNELTIDLEDPLSVRVLLSEVKKKGAFSLSESIPYEGTPVVEGPEGEFANEFLFLFHKNKE